MSRSCVSRATPCAVAAAPPTMMNRTRASASARSRARKSITLSGPATRCSELVREALQLHQLKESLLDAELQVLLQQRDVDRSAVRVDRIALGSGPPRGAHLRSPAGSE